jgi:hypothetical protein
MSEFLVKRDLMVTKHVWFQAIDDLSSQNYGGGGTTESLYMQIPKWLHNQEEINASPHYNVH